MEKVNIKLSEKKSEQNRIFSAAKDGYLRSTKYYKKTSILEIKTGDPAMDNLLKWLPYQTLSCRFFARAGFYQAGGAVGFRDQLQDCLALLYYSPSLVKKHILLCAAHQFEDGDVQHWWHPPRMGVRTRITDDMLYLPWVIADYINFTGDEKILQEMVPFLRGRKLGDAERDAYFSPEVSESASLLEHCLRAIFYNSIAENDLVYMGGGDWNDAMDKVGSEGRGTSVFNSMFMYFVINRFCIHVKDVKIKNRLLHIAKRLKGGVSKAWDGSWFLRAYMDDGTVLGSRDSAECQIDLLTQAWASLSGIVSRDGITCEEKTCEKTQTAKVLKGKNNTDTDNCGGSVKNGYGLETKAGIKYEKLYEDKIFEDRYTRVVEFNGGAAFNLGQKDKPRSEFGAECSDKYGADFAERFEERFDKLCVCDDEICKHDGANCSEDVSIEKRISGRVCVKTALKSAADRLVDYENGVIKLLDPPFSRINAGYISEYPCGVRENGGQYTHAAVWFIMALLKEGAVEYAYSLLEMLNPINHSKTPAARKKYMTEPYVLCGDVYSGEYAGMGGWSWYTGAAGWYYKCFVESVLGINIRGGMIGFSPRLPKKLRQIDVKLSADFGDIDITIDNTGEGEWTIFVGKVRYNIQYILISPSLLGKKITVKRV